MATKKSESGTTKKAAPKKSAPKAEKKEAAASNGNGHTHAAAKSPLQRQKDEHGSKEKLVDKLLGVLGSIARQDGDKDELKARLLAASNKKLLRLYQVGAEIKEKFGSVDKLAEATAKALGKAKDAHYLDRLKAFTPGRLLDAFRTAERRGKHKAA
jgi:hypothetical protein